MGTKAIILGKDKCHTGIYGFYKTVAEALKLEIDDSTRFDCTKLCVTKGIQDEIFAYYREKGSDDGEIGALWAQIGPKTNVEASSTGGLRFGFVAIAEEGFICDEEEEEMTSYRGRKRY